MKYSKTELKDLAKAWGALSLAFTIAFFGLSFDLNALIVLVIMVVVVGLGFVLHELAHKYMAQKYHCWAEFRSDNKMLLIMLAVSFFGFIFAAPGAVIIQGHITHEKNGKISLAGPMVNLILAAIFMPLAFYSTGLFGLFAVLAAKINAWLGIFNLIPFGPLDGRKVLMWNRFVWAGAGLVSVALLALSFWI